MPFNPEWDKIHREFVWHTFPDELIMSLVMQHYGATPVPSSSVTFLDLGCGTGAQTIPLVGRGFTVTAVDGSSAAISRLLNHYKNKPAPNLELIVADITTLELDPSSIDCVIDVCTLQMIPFKEQWGIVQKARKWLKPGGRFFAKMACEPFDPTINRTSFMKLTHNDDIWELFKGYSLTAKQWFGMTGDGRQASHWVIDAEVEDHGT
jgi:SAM-dependent methyltransferase